MTLRFGFVGFDHWYNAFPSLEALLRDREAEVVALAHSEPAQASYVASRYGRPVSSSYGGVIERDDVDVVCVFTSTEQNASLAIRALDAGKAVVAIKPMAMTLTEADALVEAVERTGQPYFPNDAARRLTPANVQFKQWIDQGRIGEVVSAHCVFRAGLPQAWPGVAEPGWFVDPLRAPGGAFIDHAIYHVDVLRWLFDSEVESVTGMVANVRHKQITSEDYGHGVFRFANGCMGSVEDTWTSGPGASREAIEITGTRGSLMMDSATGKIAVAGDFGLSGWIQAAPPPARGGFMNHVIRCLKGDEEAVSSSRIARGNLAACMAFYESARTGRAVRPDPGTPP